MHRQTRTEHTIRDDVTIVTATDLALAAGDAPSPVDATAFAVLEGRCTGEALQRTGLPTICTMPRRQGRGSIASSRSA